MESGGGQPRVVYEIQVQGELHPAWGACFGGLTITLDRGGRRSPITTLAGPLADQAALRGLLCRLWDLNLTLISVRRLAASGPGADIHRRRRRRSPAP